MGIIAILLSLMPHAVDNGDALGHMMIC